MKTFEKLSVKAQRAVMDMNRQPGKFIKNSEFRTKADAVRELAEYGYVTHAEEHGIEGYRLTKFGTEQAENAAKGGADASV